MNIYINILLLLMPLVFQDQHAMKSSHLKKMKHGKRSRRNSFSPNISRINLSNMEGNLKEKL